MDLVKKMLGVTFVVTMMVVSVGCTVCIQPAGGGRHCASRSVGYVSDDGGYGPIAEVSTVPVCWPIVDRGHHIFQVVTPKGDGGYHVSYAFEPPAGVEVLPGPPVWFQNGGRRHHRSGMRGVVGQRNGPRLAFENGDLPYYYQYFGRR